jgi:hypothetical protein
MLALSLGWFIGHGAQANSQSGQPSTVLAYFTVLPTRQPGA